MSKPRVAPYGSWVSPISASLVASGGVRLEVLAVDGADVYWAEGRPAEGGRNAIVRCSVAGQAMDAIPGQFDARTRVYEYGGGSYAVKDGIIYFSNFRDQRVYRCVSGGQPEAITPGGGMRFADYSFDATRDRLVCIREDHTAGTKQPVHTLVALDAHANPGGGQVLVSGADFYMYPRVSPDGTRLAWIQWDHPHMPWDAAELWAGRINASGTVGERRKVAGSWGESVAQIGWSPGSNLYFAWEKTGWWNLYREGKDGPEPLAPAEAEFGKPAWWSGSGLATFAFGTPPDLWCAYYGKGAWHLASLDTETLEFRPLPGPYTEISSLHAVNGCPVFVGSSPAQPAAVIMYVPAGGAKDSPASGAKDSPMSGAKDSPASGEFKTLKKASALSLDPGYLSLPEEIEFPTEGGLKAFAYYYRPQNKDYAAPTGDLPPLRVMSHGGPTSSTATPLNPGIQFWTSRGFAVVDVNYGGSTGYGREYRHRLNGAWGIVDVDDCLNAALFLARRGEVDPNRLIIEGGSAGGYTTLAALAFRDVFKAGCSYYGIGDLEALALDTHKFESRYLDSVVAPYPEQRQVYIERSPIHHPERLSCPVIFFQGLDDKVVPPNQAEMMVEALRRKGIPVAYVPFEGEGHGFRKAENIERALEAELYFYSRIFRFDLGEPVEPVKIENL